MTPQSQKEKRFLTDLQTLIDYNWADEARDFNEHEGERTHHIFSVLKRLKTEATRRTAQEARRVTPC